MRGRQLAVAVGLIGLSACDSLFGLDRTYEADASIDAPPGQPVIVSIRVIPGAPRVGAHVSVTVKFHRMPMEDLPFDLSASAGTFDTIPASAMLDDLGIGEITVGYTAPGSVGTVTFSVKAAGETADLGVSVVAGTSVGADHMGTSTIPVAANTVIGTKFDFPSPQPFDALGVWMASGGLHGKAALYTDGNGSPSQLVYSSGEATLTAGRNLFPGTQSAVSGARYWFLVVFDGPAAVSADMPSTGYVVGTRSYASGFPASLSAGAVVPMTGPQPMLFIELPP